MDRSTEQNAKLHAMCRDLSRQVRWADHKWDEESWKRLLLGAKFGQSVVPNPFTHGLVVVNNKRSRGLEQPDMSELIAEIQAFGDEQGVKWSDPE